MKLLSEFQRKLTPDKEFKDDQKIIISEREILTLKSLDLKTTELAQKISALGVQSNDVVPILVDHSPDFIVSVLALWMINALPVPINSRLSENEINEQFNFLQCRYVIADEYLKPKIMSDQLEIINPEIENVSQKPRDLNFNFQSDRTAVIIFTSGSSGNPKAVELSFSHMINSAKIGNDYLKQTIKDRWLASLPFYHIGGFSIIFRTLMFGTSLIIPQNLKMESIIENIEKFKPTLISFVSSQMQSLLEKNIRPNSELRHVLLGGGFIDTNLMRESIRKDWNVLKVYGSTETSSFVTLLNPEEFNNKPESAGKPIFPTEIFIMDEYGNKLPASSDGEIAVKSPAVMKGYYNSEFETKKKLRDGLYLTGDFGYKDSEGYLYVVNRRVDLIVTGGENVNPLEVEHAILQFSKVKEVFVLGIDDPKWGQKVAAAIVTKSDEKFSLDELKDFLKDKITSFKNPKEIFFVDELPKTELGKVRGELVKKMFT